MPVGLNGPDSLETEDSLCLFHLRFVQSAYESVNHRTKHVVRPIPRSVEFHLPGNENPPTTGSPNDRNVKTRNSAQWHCNVLANSAPSNGPSMLLKVQEVEKNTRRTPSLLPRVTTFALCQTPNP